MAKDSDVDQFRGKTYDAILQQIALDIEGLKSDYPQLKAYVPAEALPSGASQISYQYHIHRPKHEGGWAAAFSNPDPDGVSFMIQFWDGKSPSQAATQPGIPWMHLGRQQIVFLIMEGTETKSVEGAIRDIFRKYGAVDKPLAG